MKKTIAILGDSYSTYKGWIPKDYEAWYDDAGNSEPNDVTSVEQTWWWKLCHTTEEFEMITNCSYSGSTVCNTWYDGLDASNLSFVKRMHRELGDSHLAPDILLVFGGTNDDWAGSPLGQEKYSDWTETDLKYFEPAFCYMLDFLKRTHPYTKIYNIVNDAISENIRDIMYRICDRFETECIVLKDIQKESRHPNQIGMEQIYQQVYAAIKRENKLLSHNL